MNKHTLPQKTKKIAIACIFIYFTFQMIIEVFRPDLNQMFED